VSTKDHIAELYGRGLTQRDIARRVGVSASTVSYHLRTLGVPAQRRYDWAEVQAFYDAGHTVRACAERFGFSTATWHEAVRRGAVRSRAAVLPIEEVLTAERSRKHVKRRLLTAGLKENRCERCGIEDWLGEPLAMALHHVNGDGADNRLENLQMLCPNCHAQTDTFAGRNRGRARTARPAIGA